MESFSIAVTEFLITVPTVVQLLVLSVFSYAEGLPIVGSILPGGTIAIFAGTLAEQGLLSPVTTSFVIGISSFAGDMTGFFIGKRFKHLRWVRAIVENEKHQKNWDLFDRHIVIIAIFGKLIPVVRSTPSILAAVRGINTRKYIFCSFLGSILWAIAGVYLGNLIERFFGDKAIAIIVGIIIASIVIVSIRLLIKKIRAKR